MLSLIHEPWLPVRYKNGDYRRIRPVDILADSIRDLAFPRPDFQGAGWQFLIGLLQATMAPDDQQEWEEVWDEGLEPELFASQLASLAPAFQFGMEKPAFMQDMASLDGNPQPISSLLIEAPGVQTLKLNKDHFIKRGTVNRMCPACAAMALFTLQINAPSGGQGHRTGLRGGGPLTTLVWPPEPDIPLWRRLWLNVLIQDKNVMPASPQPVDAARFPWCGATRTSEKASNITTPEMADKQQVYWSMPRRIEIDFTRLSQGCCDLCGEASDQLLSWYRSKNYGVQYSVWVHPLTPYRRDKKDDSVPPLSMKGQSGGLFYKDWLGLIWQDKDDKNTRMPAAVVQQAARLLPADMILGLNCFAFDMDNMKSRCWYQHQLPLPAIDGNILDEFLSWLRLAVKAASDGVSELKTAIKKAGYQPREKKQADSIIDYAFWQGTQAGFILLINQLQAGISQQPQDLSALSEWRGYLRKELLKRFDDLVFSNSEQRGDLSQPVIARKAFYLALGKSSALRALALQEKNE